MLRHCSYKSTDIEWMHEIPSHWDIQPIRALFDERKERNDGLKTNFILSVMKDIGVIPHDEKGNIGNKISENIENYKLVFPNDLVLNKMNAIIGSLGVSQYYGALSQVYIVLNLKNRALVNTKYMGYVFKVKSFQTSLIKISRGIMELRESIEFDEFKKLKLPLPPIEDQTRIVNFLDRKTKEIDIAIKMKENSIKLLIEQKKSFISNAITLGLEKKINLKESGIAWLGKIPAHWTVKPLKRLVHFMGGGTPNKSNSAFWQGNIPWVSPKDVKFERITKSKECITALALKKTSVKLIPTGAILVVVRGMILARTFPVGITTLPVTINQDMKALVANESVDPEFLRYILSGQELNVLDLTEEAGHGTKTMPMEKLSNFPIVVPPLDEQIQIREYCREVSVGINKVIDSMKCQIAKLQEMREIVIAALISGQIKV